MEFNCCFCCFRLYLHSQWWLLPPNQSHNPTFCCNRHLPCNSHHRQSTWFDRPVPIWIVPRKKRCLLFQRWDFTIWALSQSVFFFLSSFWWFYCFRCFSIKWRREAGLAVALPSRRRGCIRRRWSRRSVTRLWTSTATFYSRICWQTVRVFSSLLL